MSRIQILSNPIPTVKEISVSDWSLPLVAPFRVATRTAHHAGNVLIKITADDGLYGIGSSAPVEYITGETQDTVAERLASIAPAFVGQAVDRLSPYYATLCGSLDSSPAAMAGFEMAFYDLWSKYHGISLWHYFGGSEVELASDMTIPIVPPSEARSLTEQALAEGFNVFKIKIGDSDGHSADLARIAAVVEAAPGCSLRIDANQAFAPDTAVDFVKAAQRVSNHIELIEQPVPMSDFDGLRYVKEHIDIPVFADESARSYKDVLRLIEMNAVDGVNIKLMKTGIKEAENIVWICRRFGIKLMVGCMLESPLGIAAASCLAAGLGGFDYIDLDSHKLLLPVECLGGGFTTIGSRLLPDQRGLGWGITLI